MKLEEVANVGLEVEKDGHGESTHKPGCLIETKAFINSCVCPWWAWDVGHISSQCPVLTVLGSHSNGAAAINMHQLLEKEGVLLINYNLLLAEGIDCHICMKLLLFQIPCPIHCRDGKRREVNPILLW